MPVSEELRAYINTYAARVELSSTGVDRITRLLNDLDDLGAEPCERLLVSDAGPPNQSRSFQSLIILTRHFLYEFKNFLGNFDWDIVELSGLIYARVTTNDFNLEQATSTSSMTIHLRFSGGITQAWTGVGFNCDYGLAVLRERLLPDIARRAEDRQTGAAIGEPAVATHQ